MRHDGRRPDEPRPVTIHRGYTKVAAGSVMLEMGATRVLCTASVEPGVPAFLVAKNKGWLTAEYAMLPGSTSPRKPRDRSGRIDGRSVEIQRLIGRALRNVVRLDKVGEHTIWIDCDVLDADGGTRTAAITGAFVALVDAVAASPLAGTEGLFIDSVAAISVGIVDGQAVLDLDYREDSAAAVDLNLVMTGRGRFIEVQGTGETASFSADELALMLQLGQMGLERLTARQQEALGERWPIAESLFSRSVSV